MNVLAKKFFDRKCEIRVSEDLFLMYYLHDMKVLFRKNQPNADSDSPIYFMCDDKTTDVKKSGAEGGE